MIKQLEKIFKAVGDKSRLRIINMLKEKPLCVCEITEVLGLSQSTVSGHLRVLKEAGILDDNKNGLWVEYCLNRTNSINMDVLMMIQDVFEGDQEMIIDRKKARKADREVLCKK